MSKQKHDQGFKKRAAAEAERRRLQEISASKSHWGVARGRNQGKDKDKDATA